MLQTSDFCGDRLRLSAFLRVVGDGMPQRPTRFKRRLQDTLNGLEGSTLSCHNVSCSIEQHDPKHKAESLSPDVVFLDTTQSPLPEQSTPPVVDDLPPPICSETDDVSRWRCEHLQLPNTRQQTAKRTPPITLPRSPRNVSSTRKRQRLPVNELALLSTTSSDGLPQPSDAKHGLTVPAALTDSINDSQSLSYAPTTRHPIQRPSVQCLQKSILTNDTNAIQTLKGRYGQFRFAERNRVRHQRASVTTCSDGFVGTERSVQTTKRSTKSRTGNINPACRRALNSKGLFLTRGFLPTPPLELCGDAATMTS